MHNVFGERNSHCFERKELIFFFFFLREFQPMASAPDDSSLSSNQDTNQFFIQAGIEPQSKLNLIKLNFLFLKTLYEQTLTTIFLWWSFLSTWTPVPSLVISIFLILKKIDKINFIRKTT